jgi:hypothetical protein
VSRPGSPGPALVDAVAQQARHGQRSFGGIGDGLDQCRARVVQRIGDCTPLVAEHAVDLVAQVGGEHWTRAIGRHGHADPAPIGGGRNDEGRKLRCVDDVDQDVGGARIVGDQAIQGAVVGRRHRECAVVEVRRPVFMVAVLDASLREQFGQPHRQARCNHADRGARGQH